MMRIGKELEHERCAKEARVTVTICGVEMGSSETIEFDDDDDIQSSLSPSFSLFSLFSLPSPHALLSPLSSPSTLFLSVRFSSQCVLDDLLYVSMAWHGCWC